MPIKESKITAENLNKLKLHNTTIFEASFVKVSSVKIMQNYLPENINIVSIYWIFGEKE